MKISENSDKLEPLIKGLENSELTKSFISYISDPKNAVWEYIN